MRRWLDARKVVVLSLVLALLLLSGCSLLFGGREAEETPPEEEERILVPTFTPTPEVPATPTPEPTAPPPAVVELAPVPGEEAAAPETVTETGAITEAAVITDTGGATGTETITTSDPVTAPPAEAPSPTPIPKVVVNTAAANARSGPGTEYGLVGGVTQGQAFDAIGKNPEGTWWQFCCVNGQQAWIFGELVAVENAESVPVAQNIPAPPVAAAPPQPAPTQPPAEPAAPPEEPAAPPEEPANEPEPPSGGPVNAGPCGGDDGCKFRISGGPSFAPNGGGEMKLQLFFKHSGVDGGQPQGDYRLAVERDGQLIVPFADATSIALSQNQGSMGPYNYEAKVQVSNLPGGTLEGNYYFWVLDGNRERDSEVFSMYVPPGQGEIWIEFDQG